MKILFICNNIPPKVDGVGDYTYNLVNEFIRNGHDIHILCNQKNVNHINNFNATIHNIIKRWNYESGVIAKKLIIEYSIDLVILQYVPHAFNIKGLPFLFALSLRLIKETNVKMLTFCHEVHVEYHRNISIKNQLLTILMKYVSKMIINTSDYVVTSIPYYAQLIKNLDKYKRKINILPIVSNIPFQNITDEEKSHLRGMICESQEIIVSFFGIRNINTSITAIEELQNEGYKIKVLFIGKYPNEINLTRLGFQKTGILEPNDLYKYFIISDILIIPENNDFGISFKSGSLAAAMSAGLPIITAKGMATDNSLIDNENICFTTFDSINQIKNKIIELYNNPNKRREIGNNAKKITLNRTWENTYKEYIKIINEMI